MKANPHSDWRIEDVEKPCRDYGLNFVAASGGGSHYKVSHPAADEILTIPYARPIKFIYIRRLVRYIRGLGMEP